MEIVIMRRVLGTASSITDHREYLEFQEFKPAKDTALPSCPALYYWESLDSFLVGKEGEGDDPMDFEDFEAIKILAQIPRI
jgi:hypothetical protein